MNKTRDIYLGDSNLFELAIGRRKTKKDLLSLPKGDIPIISARLDRPFGYITSDYFVSWGSKVVLWNIDSSRWDTRVLCENSKFIPTDHCGYMKILSSDIVPDYIAYKLYEIGLHLGFKHEYRASLTNIREVSIPIPLDKKGKFDIKKQIEIAEKYKSCLIARNKLIDVIKDLSEKRINISSSTKYDCITIGEIMTFKKGNAIYTEKYCKEHKGIYPVYSAGTKSKTTIGYIETYDHELECLKITTNGHYAGTIEYLPESKFSLNGDAGILYFTDPSLKKRLDYHYLEYVLQKAREQYGFNWNNKPYEDDIKNIEVLIPVKNNKWDVKEQRRIAQKNSMYKDKILRLQSCTEGLLKQFIKVD